MSMTIQHAQRDMRLAYCGGASGLLASGLVWLNAGIVAAAVSPKAGVIALCAGGMVIHPLAVVVCRAVGRTGRHDRNNPLGALALESTGLLLLCLLLAVALSFSRIDLFFPAMLIVIGARYLVFQTLYGLKAYWACGLALALAGIGLAMAGAWLPLAAWVGAALELVFAGFIARQHLDTARS